MVGDGTANGEVLHRAAVDITEEALIVVSRNDEVFDGVVATVEMATEGTGLGTDRGPRAKDIVLLPTTGSATESEINIGCQFEVEVAATVGDFYIFGSGVGTGSEKGSVGDTVVTRALIDDGAESR